MGAAALVEHIPAVRDLEAASGVLLDQERGDARAAHRDHLLEDALLVRRRKAGRGFVEQQDRWLHHQRAAHCDHLAFAAGEGPRSLARALPQQGKELCNEREALAPRLKSPKRDRLRWVRVGVPRPFR